MVVSESTVHPHDLGTDWELPSIVRDDRTAQHQPTKRSKCKVQFLLIAHGFHIILKQTNRKSELCSCGLLVLSSTLKKLRYGHYFGFQIILFRTWI